MMKRNIETLAIESAAKDDRLKGKRVTGLTGGN